MSAPENALRGGYAVLEDDNITEKLFLWCWVSPDPLRLNVWTSFKCEHVIDEHLEKSSKKGVVTVEEVRIVLDGEEVDANVTVESLEIKDRDRLNIGGVDHYDSSQFRCSLVYRYQ